MRRWFKLQMRRWIKPMNRERAFWGRHRLAFIYAFFAWNGLGMAIYFNTHKKFPQNESERQRPGLWYMRLLGVKEVDYYNYENFKLKENKYITNIPNLEDPLTNDNSNIDGDFYVEGSKPVIEQGTFEDL